MAIEKGERLPFVQFSDINTGFSWLHRPGLHKVFDERAITASQEKTKPLNSVIAFKTLLKRIDKLVIHNPLAEIQNNKDTLFVVAKEKLNGLSRKSLQLLGLNGKEGPQEAKVAIKYLDTGLLVVAATCNGFFSYIIKEPSLHCLGLRVDYQSGGIEEESCDTPPPDLEMLTAVLERY